MSTPNQTVFSLRSENRLFPNNPYGYYALAAVWLTILWWAYIKADYSMLIAPAIISLLILIPNPKRKIDIVIDKQQLSIHEGDAQLWSCLLQDISAIDYEQKGIFQLGARNAMIIRSRREDSYFLALDGLSCDQLDNRAFIAQLTALYQSESAGSDKS